jgi:hypothetical protein
VRIFTHGEGVSCMVLPLSNLPKAKSEWITERMNVNSIYIGIVILSISGV